MHASALRRLVHQACTFVRKLPSDAAGLWESGMCSCCERDGDVLRLLFDNDSSILLPSDLLSDVSGHTDGCGAMLEVAAHVQGFPGIYTDHTTNGCCID